MITVNNSSINGDYNSSKYMTFNQLQAIAITDYDTSGTATTGILNKNISIKTVEYADSAKGAWGGATITITYTDGRVLTVHLGTSTLNFPGSSNGGKYLDHQQLFFQGCNNDATVTNNTKVTVNSADESVCVSSDTLVMLANGTQKRARFTGTDGTYGIRLHNR